MSECKHGYNIYCSECAKENKLYTQQELIAVLQEVNDAFSCFHSKETIKVGEVWDTVNSIIERESAK